MKTTIETLSPFIDYGLIVELDNIITECNNANDFACLVKTIRDMKPVYYKIYVGGHHIAVINKASEKRTLLIEEQL